MERRSFSAPMFGLAVRESTSGWFPYGFLRGFLHAGPRRPGRCSCGRRSRRSSRLFLWFPDRQHQDSEGCHAGPGDDTRPVAESMLFIAENCGSACFDRVWYDHGWPECADRALDRGLTVGHVGDGADSDQDASDDTPPTRTCASDRVASLPSPSSCRPLPATTIAASGGRSIGNHLVEIPPNASADDRFAQTRRAMSRNKSVIWPATMNEPSVTKPTTKKTRATLSEAAAQLSASHTNSS